MTQHIGIGWSLGAGFGLALGSLTGEIVLWMIICVTIGSLLELSGALYYDLDTCYE